MTTRKISHQSRYRLDTHLYARCADKMCHTKHLNPYACDTPKQLFTDYQVYDRLTSEVVFESAYRAESERHLQSILDALTDAEWQQIAGA